MEKETINHSAKFIRQRKFLMVLPLLVLPFITLTGWAMGVIGTSKDSPEQLTAKGFNMNLPHAAPGKDSAWNKLMFYEKADDDSAKKASLLKSDPYYSLSSLNNNGQPDTGLSFNKKPEKLSYDPYPGELLKDKDPNEEKVYRKLAELDNELNKTKESTADKVSDNLQVDSNTNANYELDRLESMMTAMQQTDGEDPQLSRINGMLDKILDIQHPERIQDKIKQQSQQRKMQVFPVTLPDDQAAITVMRSKAGQERLKKDSSKAIGNQKVSSGFYSLNDEIIQEDRHSAIRAVIDETKEVVAGAKIKLRLLDDVYINGILIPANSPVYGKTSFDAGRLQINIAAIIYDDNILPVWLSVYDTDGMVGLDVNTNMAADVAKQSTDQAIQSLGIASLDPSFGAQAASAGIQAAKSLLGKKARVIKVWVKSGHDVLLQDNNNNE